MRRALAAIPALTAAISTFGAIWAPRSEAVCAAQVIWHGRIYIGYNGESGPEAGPALADKATLPRCDDVIINGSPRREPDTRITVNAIPDVDPIIAVVHAEAAIVYVNASTFVALPSHPLHRFYRSPKPPKNAGRRCHVSGRAVVGEGVFGVKTGKKTIVRVDITSNTRVELQRHGTGYVSPGARITVSAHSCGRRGSTRWITAARISRT